MGLEWAGVGHTVWQVEFNPFCRDVLAKHWPDVQRFNDVREVGAHNLEPVDVICGGYPCQPFSLAGKRGGEHDPRHLWPEFSRILRELRPRYAVLENVAALLTRGIGAVLGTLADLGYDAEWSVLRSCEVGAPYARPRVFVVARANGEQLGRDRREEHHPAAHRGRDVDGTGRAMARQWEQWTQEPGVDRVAYGVPRQVDRNRALGNAVTPQLAAVVGHRLLQIDAMT